MPLVTVGLLVAAAAYAYGFEGSTLQERLLRHVLATVLQILAPLVAGLGCVAAIRSYSPGDRERTVWTVGALAALAGTAGAGCGRSARSRPWRGPWAAWCLRGTSGWEAPRCRILRWPTRSSWRST